MLDQPAVLVADAPAAVLQRGFADGARESGHLVPRRGLAGRGQPGDEALLGRVAPVFGADAPACGDVVGERDVARGVDVERRGVHVLLDDDATVLAVEARGLAQVRVGPHTGGGDDDVAVERGAGVEMYAGVIDSGYGRRPQEANAVVGQNLCDTLANPVAEPLF